MVTRIALVIGLVVDLLALLAYLKTGKITLPGEITLALTETRAWMLAIIGALGSCYVYFRRTGHDIFSDSDPRIPIQAVFLIGPWVIVAGMITGMW